MPTKEKILAFERIFDSSGLEITPAGKKSKALSLEETEAWLRKMIRTILTRGGPGSGDWGHVGRPGEVGGSGGGGVEPAEAMLPSRPAPTGAYPSEGFHTNAYVEQWLHDKYPDTRFDFRGVDPIAANETAAQIDKVFTDHPVLLGLVNYIGTHPPGAGKIGINNTAYAEWFSNKGSIGLNPEQFGDAEKLHSSLLNDELCRFHPNECGNIGSVVTHELGHALKDAYTQGAVGRNPVTQFLDKYEGRDRTKFIKACDGISRYAKTNTGELFAEAFSAKYYDRSGLRAFGGESKTYMNGMTTALEKMNTQLGFSPPKWTGKTMNTEKTEEFVRETVRKTKEG